MILDGYYNHPLVILSIFVAILSAYVAIDVGSFALSMFASKKQKKIWLVVASVAISIGIWTMHFIGMLAYSLPIPIHYDIYMTFLSFLVATAACFLGFFCAYVRGTYGYVVIGGIFMGGGLRPCTT